MHAERALAFLDDHENGLNLTSTPDEVSITARFDTAHIIGHINHLGVTPEAFNVVDDKTGGLDGKTVEEAAERYWRQLEAYAVGLHQSDPDQWVNLAWYFTVTGDSRSRRYESAAFDELEAHLAYQV